ncbi:MAG: hypothetical protein LQ341_007573 [Variospora aurantia]|nr:MAG: hypothetical protein LQ341_007573 [Variospora aurantia]
MMSNFYVLNYDEDEVEKARTKLEENAQMYGMADKYGFVGLRGLARVKFNHFCNKIIFGRSCAYHRGLSEVIARALVTLAERHEDVEALIEMMIFRITGLPFEDFAFDIIKGQEPGGSFNVPVINTV